jgi:hypothetical protein
MPGVIGISSARLNKINNSKKGLITITGHLKANYPAEFYETNLAKAFIFSSTVL